MLFWFVAMVLIGAVVALVVRASFGVTRNEGLTLGTNNPYPDGIGVLGPGEDAPDYLPTPVISVREESLRGAHAWLAAEDRRISFPPATSWMEEPGGMEAAGLADRPARDRTARALRTLASSGWTDQDPEVLADLVRQAEELAALALAEEGASAELQSAAQLFLARLRADISASP